MGDVPSTPSNTRTSKRAVAGWREWVSLPGIDVAWLKAKLDTGARTSAIHAFDITEFEHDGETWVRYSVHPWQRSSADASVAETRVHDKRQVRSSSGHSEERYVVLMDICLVGQVVTAEVTLSRRDEMGFRMLIGREALRRRFVVDAGRSYVGDRPESSTRLKNRGR